MLRAGLPEGTPRLILGHGLGATREMRLDAFAERFTVHVETVSTADENVFFPLPRRLREDAAAS